MKKGTERTEERREGGNANLAISIPLIPSSFLPSLVRSWAIFLVRRGERAKVAQLASVRPRGRGEREDAVDGSLDKLSTKLGRCLLFSKSSNGQFGR